MDRQLRDRDAFIADVRERLFHAQDLMSTQYDKHHRDVEFQVGDWVWLRLHQQIVASITDKSAGKLAPRFYGPFRVTERV